MIKFVTWLQDVVLPFLGPWGVFLAAFLDASFVSLPEINDILVVNAAIADVGTAWVAVAMATLGSLAGCTVVWWMGRKGREAFLVRHFGERRTIRARNLFHKWGPLALAVPALAPPPMPFKIFVIAAGVFGFPWGRFALTILIARGIRYGAWAVVGAVYGDEAMGVLRGLDHWASAHQPWLVGIGAGAVAAVVVILLRRRAARPRTEVV